MIIDFHTHAFPDKIVEQTITLLKDNSGTIPYSDGRYSSLADKAKRAGVKLSVVLPVVTHPSSTRKINEFAQKVNETSKDTGLFSFGGIHPDSTDIRGELKEIFELGLKGVKVHPAFQRVPLNDARYKKIIETAEEFDLITVVHGGKDIGIVGDFSSPYMAEEILNEIKPKRFVLAHMGGWAQWEEVKNRLIGRDIYLDTAFSLKTFNYREDVPASRRHEILSEKDFLQMVKRHGADKILFGTDSPWGDQKEQIDYISSLPLTEREKTLIFSKNAEKLLYC